MKLSSTALASALAAFALGALAPTAGAYVTDQQAGVAADAAKTWFSTQQESTDGSLGDAGFFGGDWSMIALAGQGTNAADLRAGSLAPSLQDFYFGGWEGAPDEQAPVTDFERIMLTGTAGGVQTAKVSAQANYTSALAGRFDGGQLGETALLNDDIFGLLALERAGAARAVSPTLAAHVKSRQQTDGGWNFAGTDSSPDTDVTGATIASLCAAGATASDPAVAKGIEFLKSTQNATTGGFDSTFFGANADSTAFAVNGLRQCGVDPQGAEFTKNGRTPLDFLMTLRNDDGSFAYAPGSDPQDPFSANLYSTQDAVTALVGEGFGAEAPEREDPADPAYRPAPPVADGTVVPMTLVLDHGTATPGAERICSVEAPVGASVSEVLTRASTQTTPTGCVTGLRTAGGRVASLNGVSTQPGTSWSASVDGGPASASLEQEVGLGGTVALTLTGRAASQTPAAPLPRLDVPETKPAMVARAVMGKARRQALGRRGFVVRYVRCPAGVGVAGCRGKLRIQYRKATKWATAGSRTFFARSGSRTRVRIKVSRRLRALVAKRPKSGRAIRVVASVRDRNTNAVNVTRVRATLRR